MTSWRSDSLEPETHRQRLTRHAAGSFAMMVASAGLVFLVSLLFARVLGVERFGAYAYAMSWLALLCGPGLLGLDRLLVREVAVYQENQQWNLLKGILKWSVSVTLFTTVGLTCIALGIWWFVGDSRPGEMGDVELHFFGSGSEVYQQATPSIHGHGFVERLEDVWNKVNFMACPMFSGSGVNVKLAESLFNGVPVLATPFAVRGLDTSIQGPWLAIVPPEDWVDYLTSDEALALASSRVDATVRSRFALDSHANAANAFLRDAMTQTNKNSNIQSTHH